MGIYGSGMRPRYETSIGHETGHKSGYETARSSNESQVFQWSSTLNKTSCQTTQKQPKEVYLRDIVLQKAKHVLNGAGTTAEKERKGGRREERVQTHPEEEEEEEMRRKSAVWNSKNDGGKREGRVNEREREREIT